MSCFGGEDRRIDEEGKLQQRGYNIRTIIMMIDFYFLILYFYYFPNNSTVDFLVSGLIRCVKFTTEGVSGRCECFIPELPS